MPADPHPARRYNGPQSPVGLIAAELKHLFDTALHQLLNPAAMPLPPMVQPPGAAAGASAADGADAGAPKQFGRPTPSAPPLQTAPRAPPPPAAPPRATTPSHSARAELRSTYRRVINNARLHVNGQVYKTPVPWEKIGLLDYPNIVKNPMDLSTIGKRLEHLEYANLEELWADLNLMFDNAKLFNGPDSWVTKHEVGLRSFLEKKMAEACKKATAGGGSAGGMVRGNVATITIDDKMLTPQMRLHLYQNCAVLQPRQLRDFRDLVRQLCPMAIEDGHHGEVKIDVDAFDFRTFIRVDTWVRLQALQVLTTA